MWEHRPNSTGLVTLYRHHLLFVNLIEYAKKSGKSKKRLEVVELMAKKWIAKQISDAVMGTWMLMRTSRRSSRSPARPSGCKIGDEAEIKADLDPTFDRCSWPGPVRCWSAKIHWPSTSPRTLLVAAR